MATTLGSTCAVISQNTAFTCATPPLAGTLDNILLINPSEVSSITATANVISDITMLSTKEAYVVAGVIGTDGQPSAKPRAELINDGLVPGWKHILEVTILDKTATTAANVISKLPVAPVMAVFETKDPAEPFVVLGRTHGLKAVSATRDFNDGANGGCWTLVLETPPGLKELYPEYKLLDTDYDTPAALVVGLQTPA